MTPTEHESVPNPAPVDVAATASAANLTGARMSLLVIGKDLFAAHPLPQSGQLAIGRAAASGARIDDLSVSAEHAVLEVGPPLVIRDVGSANGTRLRGTWLKPGQAVPLTPGEVIELGSVLVIVQHGDIPAVVEHHAVVPRARRLSSPSELRSRLEQELEHAARGGAPCAVLAIVAEVDVEAGAVEPAVMGALRSADLVCCES